MCLFGVMGTTNKSDRKLIFREPGEKSNKTINMLGEINAINKLKNEHGTVMTQDAQQEHQEFENSWGRMVRGREGLGGRGEEEGKWSAGSHVDDPGSDSQDHRHTEKEEGAVSEWEEEGGNVSSPHTGS